MQDQFTGDTSDEQYSCKWESYPPPVQVFPNIKHGTISSQKNNIQFLNLYFVYFTQNLTSLLLFFTGSEVTIQGFSGE
jgi:hypothetical protein